jgi:ribose 1,5-bisphosphokinase
MEPASGIPFPDPPPQRYGPGFFVALAGPSGAGKDSLIAGAREHFRDEPRIRFVTRVITRPEDGSEPYEASTPLAFRLRAERDEFLLWWEANGLSYGLPMQLLDDIRHGRVVVANISRDVTSDVRAMFAHSLIVHVTASTTTLMKRMTARGRENAEERAARLARALLKDQALEADVRIENDGPLAESVQRFITILQALLSR